MSDASAPLDRLLTIMARLRHRELGCDWDLAQDFASIAPYTIEEAYEVSDAIARNDMNDLRGELGDLLFQVVFHSRMAEEQGHFAFADVVESISNKMEARHPHIFGHESGIMDEHRWEDLKADERTRSGFASAMDGVAGALPALMRAQKLQKRAARDGFDWPNRHGPEAKIAEEMKELNAASDDELLAEAGDFLFAAVNLVRKYGIDAEEALRQGNAKFERRYRAMEQRAAGQFAELSLEQQEAHWQAVKAAECL